MVVQLTIEVAEGVSINTSYGIETLKTLKEDYTSI